MIFIGVIKSYTTHSFNEKWKMEKKKNVLRILTMQWFDRHLRLKGWANDSYLSWRQPTLIVVFDCNCYFFVSGEDWLENYQEKWAATFLWSPGGIFAVPFQRYLFLMFKRTHYSFNLPNVDVNTDYCCIWCRLWDLLLQSAWSLLWGRAGSLLLRRGNHPHPPAHGPL